jgi:ferric-dicitrate binding protein FerR (iron transport regulator)
VATDHEERVLGMLGAILDEQQASKADFRDALAAHEARDDERFERLTAQSVEQRDAMRTLRQILGSARPPSLVDVKEEVAAHDRAVKAERWDTVVKNAGKIALALIVAGLIFAGGSFYRDITGPRGGATTITTIAPGQAQR